MENREVLNKTVTVEGETAVINETVQTTLTKQGVEERLSGIRARKNRIKMTNANLVSEYNSIVAEEVEFSQLLAQLQGEDEVIETL